MCVRSSLDARIPVATETAAIPAFIAASHLCTEQRNFGEHFLTFALVDCIVTDFRFHYYHLLFVVRLVLLRSLSGPVSDTDTLHSGVRSRSLRRTARGM